MPRAKKSKLQFWMCEPAQVISQAQLLTRDAHFAFMALMFHSWFLAKDGRIGFLVDDLPAMATVARMDLAPFRADVLPELIRRGVLCEHDGRYAVTSQLEEFERVVGIMRVRREASEKRWGTGSDGDDPDQAPAGEQCDLVPRAKPEPPTKPVKATAKSAAAPRETWLTPYWNSWREIIGAGTLDVGIAATPFKRALAEITRRGQSEEDFQLAFRNYLYAHVGPESRFISLPKFANTWPQWVSRVPQQRNLTASEKTAEVSRRQMAIALAEDEADEAEAVRARALG